MRTVALDVHKRFAEVAVHERGEVRRLGRIETSELRAFAESLRPDDQVVLESTSMTWAIAELLGRHAGRVTVSNPLRTKAIASAKVKTDKVDARVLAQLAAADFLPAVWAPDEPTRALRRRVLHRASLVRQRTRLRNQVHAVLARHLVDVPVTDLFGQKGRCWLAGVELPAHEREQVESNLRLHDALDSELKLVDGQLAQRALADAEVRRLMTIPGVGPVTALSLLAVIGDVTRFPSSGQLVGYLGLDPRVRQSGERPARTGHISRAGQAHARGLLVEPPTWRSGHRDRCAPSTHGSRPAAARRSRSALPRASSRCSAGTCSAEARTTATAPRRSWSANSGGCSAKLATTVPGSASPARRDGARSSGDCSRRPNATTAPTSPNAHEAARAPPLGKRLLLALEGQTMRGRPNSPHGLLFSSGSLAGRDGMTGNRRELPRSKVAGRRPGLVPHRALEGSPCGRAHPLLEAERLDR
jgi:transposase